VTCGRKFTDNLSVGIERRRFQKKEMGPAASRAIFARSASAVAAPARVSPNVKQTCIENANSYFREELLSDVMWNKSA
jgi:hypothetical protein